MDINDIAKDAALGASGRISSAMAGVDIPPTLPEHTFPDISALQSSETVLLEEVVNLLRSIDSRLADMQEAMRLPSV